MADERHTRPVVDPARPDAGFTDDGRPLRELTTYTRRGSRFTRRQEAAWGRRAEVWSIPATTLAEDGLDAVRWFGREAPLIVEIGSGIGEATAALAAARPDHNVLALEVWKPGVAETFLQLEKAEATNVRLASLDAVWAMQHLLAPGSVSELWTFFPDPWPKKRHHRRRLITPEFASTAASRLVEGALWRLATDWPDYALHLREVLDAEPHLRGGPVERWPDRPVTKFERRGIAAGRPAEDFAYTRV